jgi:peptidoglycan/LPS O-acetylase OafA/YrhL
MTTYLLRGLGGFGIGVGCWRLFVGSLEARRGDPPRFIASVCEVTWFVAVFIIVAHREFAGKLFIADLVFGLGIIIFAAQLGAVSNMLRLRPFYWLGILSYSIYLIHSPLETVVALVLYKLGLAFRVPIESRTQINLGAVGSELMGLATLVLVVAAAWITWRVIEEPCRRWSRRKISHLDARKAVLARPPVTQVASGSPALG